jgi:ABC-2 type transport system permease protein
MTNVITIMSKELKAYFISPVFYFVTFFFLLITGAFYTFYISTPTAIAEMGTTLNTMVLLLFFICPILTMHLFSEERRAGTIELLMTYPIRDWEVVVGKYLASFVLLLIMVLCTIELPILLSVYGTPDLGPILSSYAGFLLLAGSFLAVGVLGSALAKSQMLSSGISLMILLSLMVVGYAGYMLGPGRIGSVLEYLPGTTHFRNFGLGLLDTRDLVFFFSFIFFSLFTAVRVVEIKRWK